MDINQFDPWLEDDGSGPAALVVIELLQPAVEGETAIFPPTYAPELGASNKKAEYVIDSLRDGHNVCQIDSVGSQANRLEPIFKQAPYDKLVPQVTVKVAEGQEVNLLDAGHRAADAIVRFSSLHEEVASAFDAWLKGDASELAVIAPTSLLFGAWDSRGTQAKAPRILSSTIRAYDVEFLSRSATYIPAVDYVELGLIPEELAEKQKGEKRTDSQLGFVHANASRVLGGILVRGEIRREAILNLVSLRALGAVDEKGSLDKQKTMILRRYILGLGLVALTKPMIHNLRQGCLLVGIEDKQASWKLVYATGKRKEFLLEHSCATDFAEKATVAFLGAFPSVKSSEEDYFKPVSGHFDSKLAKAAADEKTARKEAAKTKKGRVKGGVLEAAQAQPESAQ